MTFKICILVANIFLFPKAHQTILCSVEFLTQIIIAFDSVNGGEQNRRVIYTVAEHPRLRCALIEAGTLPQIQPDSIPNNS